MKAALYFCFLSRYASLYFCCAVEDQENELITLEIIHRYVELLDKYFGSVSLARGPQPSRLCFLFFFLPFFMCLCIFPSSSTRYVSWTSFSTLRRHTTSWTSSYWVGKLRRRLKRLYWRPLNRQICCKRWGKALRCRIKCTALAKVCGQLTMVALWTSYFEDMVLKWRCYNNLHFSGDFGVWLRGFVFI